MSQPPGFVNFQLPIHVFKLKKSIHGLKQAPRAWYIELTTFILSVGFCKSQADTYLFIYNHKNILIYLLVYIIDFVLTGYNTSFLDNIFTSLATKFSIKYLCPLHRFLGVEVIPTLNGFSFSNIVIFNTC